MKTYSGKFSVLSISLGAILLAYLLWPLTDAKWNFIEENSSDEKRVILESIHSNLPQDSFQNVILIVADDLGFGDISINGNQYIQTEHIDYLAKNGNNFLNAYCTAPICATSRAAILTGRYQNRYGFEFQMQNRYAKNRLEVLGMNWFIDSNPWSLKKTTSTPDKAMESIQGLPKSEITIAEILRQLNYRTGIIGKWHLGKQKGKLPLDFGFDYHYGFYNSHSLYIPEGTPGYIDTKVKEDWTDPYIWQSQRNDLSAIVENGIEIEESNYITDEIANKTINFIDSSLDHPFFAYVPFNAPHSPFQAPENLYNQLSHIKDPVKRTYQAMIKSLDLAIGKIYAHLDQKGLLENTIIIITSDNGGARYTTATDNAPYKGGKINQFEGGLRIPFITFWKEKQSSKSVENRISTLDIVSSILSVNDVKIDRIKFDGKDIFNQNENFENRDLYWQVGESKTIISEEYKLIFNVGENSFQRLYNLAKDPHEKSNISSTNQSIVKSLILKHNNWSKQMAKPLWPGVVNYKVEDDDEILLFES